jgi:signal transduction histidine kinase
MVAFATAPARAGSTSLSLRDIGAAAAANARACAARGVTVSFAGNRAAFVAGNAALLSAAVELVVRNSLEAMPEGGRLTIDAEESGSRCRLWIRDSGPGIPGEVQERLFEPFVTTKPFGHLGVGLALANELVRAQEGTLTVTSSAGLGTTVVFTLPAATTKETPVSNHSPGRQPCHAADAG